MRIGQTISEVSGNIQGISRGWYEIGSTDVTGVPMDESVKCGDLFRRFCKSFCAVKK